MLAITSLPGFLACGEVADSSGRPAIQPSTTADFRPVGAPCAFATQCVSGGCSADLMAGGCGRCLEVRRLGESCDGPLQACSSSAECRDGICRSTKRTAGQPCELDGKRFSDDCDDELYCTRDGGDAGICTAKSTLGGACSSPYQTCAGNADCERGICVAKREGALGDSCEDRPCGEGLFCHGEREGLTCTGRRSALPRGARCGGDAIERDCAAGTHCELTGAPADGDGYPMACLPDRAEGEECALGRCAEELFCDKPEGETAYRCQRLRLEGEACSSGGGDCITGLECRQNRCLAACR